MLLVSNETLALELKFYPSQRVIPGSVVALVVDQIRDKEASDIRIIADGVDLPIAGRLNNSIVTFLGVDLFKRGDIRIEVRAGGNVVLKRNLKVDDHKFPLEELTLPPEKVFLSEEDLKRAEEEKQFLDRIWIKVTPERLWSGDFIIPASGREGSSFGLRRIINGEERSPHTGRDIVADEGTPVYSVNRGRVVWRGELFFGGNSIIIDHGLGLYSMYFHLSRILVEEGKIVERGEQIGLVGSTGRASGPHLHWGIRLLNARVDPISFQSINGLLKEIK